MLRAEIFFGTKDGKVIITHLEGHNSTPHIVKWEIPLLEWQSISKISESLKRGR